MFLRRKYTYFFSHNLVNISKLLHLSWSFPSYILLRKIPEKPSNRKFRFNVWRRESYGCSRSSGHDSGPSRNCCHYRGGGRRGGTEPCLNQLIPATSTGSREIIRLAWPHSGYFSFKDQMRDSLEESFGRPSWGYPSSREPGDSFQYWRLGSDSRTRPYCKLY